jgi:hypothetical protein
MGGYFDVTGVDCKSRSLPMPGLSLIILTMEDRVSTVQALNFIPLSSNDNRSAAFEPVLPCLQSTGVLFKSSFLSFGFQCFQQFGESAFRSKLTPM